MCVFSEFSFLLCCFFFFALRQMFTLTNVCQNFIKYNANRQIYMCVCVVKRERNISFLGCLPSLNVGTKYTLCIVLCLFSTLYIGTKNDSYSFHFLPIIRTEPTSYHSGSRSFSFVYVTLCVYLNYFPFRCHFFSLSVSHLERYRHA